MNNIHLVYFSPALSTRRIMREIGKNMGAEVKEYDITMGLGQSLDIDNRDLVVFGIPVYAGRVPELAVNAFRKIKGKNTPAVLVCVYGNRDYDDALLELKDICEENGFVAMAAAAFIARHSIFSGVAEGRPDEDDRQKIAGFAQECMLMFQSYDSTKEYAALEVKGNRPYREPSKGGYVPAGDESCDACGICVKQCPVEAIRADDPKITDMDLCIRCARCITLCPEHSRAFRGELYEAVKAKFAPMMAARREPEVFFNKI
ncbi:4Fe-4S ferredoxin [Dysgonomonas sp. 521]|uniref:4Fe-4S binding protein n=1 Tax=Dysgonomonas sp. 521 TaxID=2302932 RepID=UPI0013D04B33|nr:4Fe-4S binding protein [Dysgonomonas sp. 521]NDV94984.1 4Fe-4S ferredoxin [Dysgonomonas sp. 521]